MEGRTEKGRRKYKEIKGKEGRREGGKEEKREEGEK